MTTESRDLGIILIMPDSLLWKRPIIQNINNILGYINKYTEIINVRKHKTGEELIYPLSDKSIYTQYKRSLLQYKYNCCFRAHLNHNTYDKLTIKA